MSADRPSDPCRRAVTVVVPFFRNKETIGACVRALRTQTIHPDWDLVVVDAGPDPSALSRIPELSGVRVVKGRLGGVARSLNAAFRGAPGRDVVRVHADVVVDSPDWLSRLAAAAHSGADVGAAGGRLVFPDGRIQSEGRTIISGMGMHPQHCNRRAFQPDSAPGPIVEVDTVPGALAYYRREALDAVGGLDEGYGPVWMDDDDICVAFRRAGYRVLVDPSARAVHFTRAHPPTFAAQLSGASDALDQLTYKLKDSSLRIQAARWEAKWGWNPFYPDVAEIRRLYGATALGWRVGESLRFRPSEELPTVDCCLVTYNCCGLLRQLMDSLAGTDYPAEKVRVYITDNGSSDATGAYLAGAGAGFPFELHVISLAANTGVAAGLNFAMAAGSGELVARLDDDVVLPPHWLRRLLGTLRRRPFAGCVGTKTINNDDRRSIQWACPHAYPSDYKHRDEVNAGQADYLARVTSIHGCCTLYRRDTLDRCGLIDIRYSPSQFDDIDHGIALVHAGYEIVYDGTVEVVHKINNGLDRSQASLASSMSNCDKMLGKWGKDVAEVLETALMLSREGRYLPDDGDTSAWLSAGPAASDFPRLASASAADLASVASSYETLSAAFPPGSPLDRLCADHLRVSQLLAGEGRLREALNVAVVAVNLAPTSREALKAAAALQKRLGSASAAAAAARRGLLLYPDDSDLRSAAKVQPADIASEESSARAAASGESEAEGAPGLRVLLLDSYQHFGAPDHRALVNTLRDNLAAAGVRAGVARRPNPDASTYDVVHVCGLRNPVQAMTQVKAIRSANPGAVVVVSPEFCEGRESSWMGAALARVFARAGGSPAAAQQGLAEIAAGRFAVKGELRPVVGRPRMIPSAEEALQREILGLCDHAIVSGKAEADAITTHLGVLPPASVCPPSLDFDVIENSAPKRFIDRYRIQGFVLVEAPIEDIGNLPLTLHALGTRFGPIVVAGPDLDISHARLCERQAPQGTRFLGRLDPAMLASAYKAASVVVYPALSSPFSTNALSAVYCGCPVALGERLHEREYTGALATAFKSGDPESLRSAVAAAVAGRAARAPALAAWRAQVRQLLTPAGQATTLARIYAIAIEGARRRKASEAPPLAISPAQGPHL